MASVQSVDIILRLNDSEIIVGEVIQGPAQYSEDPETGNMICTFKYTWVGNPIFLDICGAD